MCDGWGDCVCGVAYMFIWKSMSVNWSFEVLVHESRNIADISYHLKQSISIK